MEKYGKSICSTCRYLATCVLTANKSLVTSCSEYDHAPARKKTRKLRYV
ncbi:hypothetical protein [Sinomicrobium pectinilyticum]|nr:hypothetical protein [Sinomicrobium pectinilyticum]